jgi:hypothetical protein
VIATTNYHGYDNYKCDKVLIVTTNYHAMITINVIKYWL